MAIKITAESFLSVLKRSGLVKPDVLDRLLSEFKRQGLKLNDSRVVANALVKQDALTAWQAEKLLGGKHKGFFLGKYRLLSLLGKGGMSSVFLAEHTLMLRRCAVKVLPAKFVNDSSYLGRFHREAQAVASLDHLNIVRAYDVDKQVHDGVEIHFLVMEHVDGRSLQDIVLNDGPLGFIKAADYVRQAADGLAHAHQAGILHRDVKPSNLLVDTAGVVKILDLGLAKFFHEDEKASLTVAHAETMLGTADYVAPEQALDSHNVDARADIYSLGCTFFFLLTGSPPYDKGSLTQRLMSHQSKPPPPIEQRRPGVPDEFARIIHTMMAKKPERRFQAAGEVSLALTDWLREHAGEKWKLRNPLLVRSSESIAVISESDETAQSRSKVPGQKQPPQKSAAKRRKQRESSSRNQPQTARTRPDDELAGFLASLDSPDSQATDEPSGPDATLSGPRSANGGKSSARKTTAEIAGSDPAGALNRSGRKPPPIAQPSGPPVEAGESESPNATLVSGNDSGSTVVRASAAMDHKDHSGSPARPADSTRTTGSHAIADPVATDSQSHIFSDTSRTLATDRMPLKRKIEAALSRAASLLKTPAGLGAAVVAACVLAAVVYGVFSGQPDDAGVSPVESQKQTKTVQGPGKSPATRPQWIDTGEIAIGPRGDFQSIQAAIADVKTHYSPLSRRDVLTLKVAGGVTYPDRILIDNSDFSFPKGLRIVCEGEKPAVLSPAGPEPVVTLKGIERFAIEGFELNATGKKVAVELSGYLLNTKLRRLRIVGFEEAGISADGPAGLSGGGDRVFFEQLVFRTEHAEAVGMRFAESSSHRPSNLRVAGCRYYGPMAAGIAIRGSAIDVDIRESIFAETADGIRFDGTHPELRNITIANNTFYQVQRGIRFRNAPAATSDEFVFRRNLFVNTAQAEGSMQRGFDRRAFLAMIASGGIAMNWSNRPAPPDPASGELPLFGNQGRQGVACEFVSTDPGHDQFLTPTPNSAHRSIGAITAN